jgi:EAL domain-containing protein (putative c-di-GMP-specific phosphodiesterase class I)
MTLKSIAEVLDCKLVAEGVDDPETLDFLKKNGCQLYQGYLFSKGVTFEDSLKMIKKNIKEYSEE